MQWRLASPAAAVLCLLLLSQGARPASGQLQSSANVTVAVNSKISISCTYRGAPPVGLSLQQLTPTTRTLNPVSTGLVAGTSDTLAVFEIAFARETDAGEYACVANTATDTLTKSVFVAVTWPPRMTLNVPFDAKEGTEVTLTCTVSANPAPTYIRWTTPAGSVVEPQWRAAVGVANAYESLLTLSPVVFSNHSGAFVCASRNPVVAADTTQSATLRVSTQPQVQILGTNVTSLLRGSQVRLQCLAQGTPAPTVTDVFFNDVAVTFSRLSSTATSDQVEFDLGVVDETDIGEFKCVAANAWGIGRGSRSVDVWWPPVVTRAVGTPVSVREGRPLYLTCTVNSNPPPYGVWIVPDSVRSVVVKKPSTCVGGGCLQPLGGFRYQLTFNVTTTKASVADTVVGDDGTYLCGAGNTLQTKNIFTDPITVDVVRISPVIVQDLPPNNTLTFRRDYDGVVICSVNESTLSFTLLQLEATPPNVRSPTTKSYDGVTTVATFNLGRMSTGNRGHYVCNATLSDGAVSQATFLIDVNWPPVVKVSNVTAREGNPVTLDCVIDAYPAVQSVSWTPKSTQVSEAGSFARTSMANEFKSSYVVPRADFRLHHGLFRCSATSELGTASDFGAISVESVPRISTPLPDSLLTFARGETRTVVCSAFGYPLPSVTLAPTNPAANGVVRNLNWKSDVVNTDAATRTSTFEFVSLSDSNIQPYSCLATNPIGTGNATFRIDVVWSPLNLMVATPSSPAVAVAQLDQREGDKLELVCSAYANPEPTFTWSSPGTTPLPVKVAGSGRYIVASKLTVASASYPRDHGNYSCRAANAQGPSVPSDVTVVVNVMYIRPPLVLDATGATVTSLEFTSGGTAVLQCDVAGNPPPSVYLRHVDASRSYAAVSTTTGAMRTTARFQVTSLSLNNNGTYVCVASSLAGAANATAAVAVLQAPVFLSLTANLTVVDGQTLELKCVGESNPRPDQVTWLLPEGQELASTTLKVTAFQFEATYRATVTFADDDGPFTCRAANRLSPPGGAVRSTFVTVLWPPRVTAILPANLNVYNGTSLTLDCQVSARPKPTVTWVFAATGEETAATVTPVDVEAYTWSGQLTLDHVSFLRHHGQVTCRAQNSNGTASASAALNVTAAPVFAAARNPPSVLLGDRVPLTCVAYGNPPPTVTAAGSQPVSLLPSSPSHPKPFWTQIQFWAMFTEFNDSFDCQAANAYGTASLHLPVTVVSHPLVTLEATAPPPYVEGVAVRLQCRSVSNPVAVSVRWQTPRGPIAGDLTVTDSLHASSELVLPSPSALDAGLYRCVVSNGLNESTADLSLDIWTAPRVTAPASFNASLRATARVLCRVTANPPANLTLQRPSRPLLSPLSSNRTAALFVVDNLDLFDDGDYQCVGQNEVAARSAPFSLGVLTAPLVDMDSVSLRKDDLFRLTCRVTANPTASVTWFKPASAALNEPFQELRDVNATTLQTLFYLVHPSFKSSLAGVYTCLVSNELGNAQRTATADLLLPAVITGANASVSVKEGSALTLVCSVTANPPPTVVWLYPNGNTMDKGITGAKPLFASVLHLDRTVRADAGAYICRANNGLAAAVDAPMNVEVRCKPHITMFDTSTLVVRSNDSLRTFVCEADCVPTPTYTWQMDSDPPVTGDLSTFVLDPATLRLPVHVACQASNSEGSETASRWIDYRFRPRVTFTVTKNFPFEGDIVAFNCIAEGNPLPEISTDIVGDVTVVDKPISTYMQQRVVTYASVRLEDSGTYTCTATNAEGADSASIQMQVNAPPTITRDKPQVIVLAGDPATLTCLVRGSPALSVIWQPSGTDVEAVQVDTFTRRRTIEVDKKGLYTCIAENTFGRATYPVEVIWDGKPRITYFTPNGTVPATGANLTCIARGDPAPSLRLIGPDGQDVHTTVTSLDLDSTLVAAIAPFNLVTSGNYTCVASNVIASTASLSSIEVYPLGPNMVAFTSNVTKMKGESAVLICEAEGNPPPLVKWRDTTHGVPFKEEIGRYRRRATLTFASLGLDQMGSYPCDVTSSAGSLAPIASVTVWAAPEITLLTVPSPILGAFNVSCAAKGNPPPQLTLLIPDGTTASKQPGLPLLTEFFYQYGHDPPFCLFGDVLCTATNSFGRDAATRTPVFGSPPKELTISKDTCTSIIRFRVGQDGSMNCSARAAPNGRLAWSYANNQPKDARLVEVPAYQNCMMSNQLKIASLTLDDMREYRCTAVNDYGQSTTTALLEVWSAPQMTFNYVLDGDQVKLACSARGYPPLTTLNIIDGTTNNVLSVTPVNGDVLYTKTTSATTTFKNGTFQCYAENEAGIASKEYNLYIYTDEVTSCPVTTTDNTALIVGVFFGLLGAMLLGLVIGMLLYRACCVKREKIHPRDLNDSPAIDLSRASSMVDLTDRTKTPVESFSKYLAPEGTGGYSNELSEQLLLSGALPGVGNGQVEHQV